MEKGRYSERLKDSTELHAASGQSAVHEPHHDVVLEPVLGSHVPVRNGVFGCYAPMEICDVHATD